MFCTIWYHLNNLKNVKNTHGGELLVPKVTLRHGCFSRFSNCKNGTKSHKTLNMLTFQMVSLFFGSFTDHKNQRFKYIRINGLIVSR